MALPASQATFAGSNSSPLIANNAAWGTYGANSAVVYDSAFGGGAAPEGGVWWKNDNFPANQYSQARCKSVDTGWTYTGVSVRIQPGTAANCYAFVSGNNAGQNSELWKLVDGTFTTLGSSTTRVTTNDVMHLSAVGTVLRAYINGILRIGPLTDTTYGSGAAGLHASDSITGNIRDQWEGGRAYATVSWGPGTVNSDYDTVMGDNNGFGSQGYNGLLTIDDSDTTGYGWKAIGLRFPYVNIPNAGTIFSATLTLVRSNDNSGANGTLRIKCEDSNSPGTWNDSRRPYNQTYRTTYVDHGFPDNGDQQYIQVGTLIQNLLDGGYSYSGAATHAIAFGIMGSLFGLSSVSWRNVALDFNVYADTVVKLDIVYATTISDGVTEALSSQMYSASQTYENLWRLQSLHPISDLGSINGKARFLFGAGTNPNDQRSKEMRYRFYGTGSGTKNLIARFFEAGTELGSGTHLTFGSGVIQGSFNVTGTVTNWATLVAEIEGWGE